QPANASAKFRLHQTCCCSGSVKRMPKDGRIAVIGALTGNIAVAVMKFIAAAMSGSSALLSEGIHSTVDSGNQLLMLFGMRRSRRPPDEHHQFGYGKELYFWSLIVGVLIFGAGGCVSIYEGIRHILHPVAIRSPKWNFFVLGAAF